MQSELVPPQQRTTLVEVSALDATRTDTDREQKQKKKKVFEQLTQKSYSQRSRSSEGSRSRDAKKQKSKHKHKKRHSRSRQDRDHHRSKDREKDHKKKKYNNEREYRDRRDRDRRDYNDRYPKSREQTTKPQAPVQPTTLPNGQKLGPNEIPMPALPEEVMPMVPGERRKRQRSRSPLGYYRRNQTNNDGQFWDSFSWVPRMNFMPNVTNSALANTKKMRRLMITNIPYEIGITEQDLRNLITRFMAQNYLKDEMNSCPVVNLQINEEDHNVAVEMSSVEQTCRICKLEKIQLFKGVVNGIIRLGDSCYGNNIVTQAQTAAQAQAAAFAAINVLQNKRNTFSVDNLNANKDETSTLVRIVNGITPYMADHLNAEQWTEYQEDLLEGFSQFGTIVHHWFVKTSEKDICADPGNLFVEYESKSEAVKAMEEMQGRIYDERVVALYYIPRELYYQNYKKNITPPTINSKK